MEETKAGMVESTFGTGMARFPVRGLRLSAALAEATLWVQQSGVRWMRRLQLSASLAAAGAAFAPGMALAAPGRGLHVAYRAPSTCPPQGTLEEAVVRRLAGSKRRDLQGSLDVRIEAVDGKFRGRLRVPGSSDANLTREVWSDDCAELVRALGLVGAVLMDPSAASEPDAAEQPGARAVPVPHAEGSEDGASAKVEAEATTPREVDGFASGEMGNGEEDAIAAALREPSIPESQRGRRRAPGRRVHPRAEGLSSKQSSPSNPPRPWLGHVALGGAGQTGIAPTLAVGPRLSLDLGPKPAAGALGFLGRVSLAGAWSGRVPGTVGDAKFTWFASRLETCASAASGAGSFVTPCALAELGTYRAKGQRAAKLHSPSALWLALGTSLRGEVTLSGPYSLYGEGSVTAPLRRPHFFFARSAKTGGEDEVHRVPGATYSAGIGMSVRFL